MTAQVLFSMYFPKKPRTLMPLSRENYWTIRLKTLTPFGLNQELN